MTIFLFIRGKKSALKSLRKMKNWEMKKSKYILILKTLLMNSWTIHCVFLLEST